MVIRSSTPEDPLDPANPRNTIQEQDPPGQALDADHRPAAIDIPTLEKLWKHIGSEENATTKDELWDRLDDTGNLEELPSGDGKEGGWFHTWFEVGREIPERRPPVIDNFVKVISRRDQERETIPEEEREVKIPDIFSLWLEVEFSEIMDASNLQLDENWLGVWLVAQVDDAVAEVTPVPIREAESKDEDGKTIFRGQLEPELVQRALESRRHRILVSIRGFSMPEDGQPEPVLTAAAEPHHALDGDFRPSALAEKVLVEIWRGVPGVPEDVFTMLDTPPDVAAALPSGDGEAGGVFHTWFMVKGQQG
jgi:hypothetical protein